MPSYENPSLLIQSLWAVQPPFWIDTKKTTGAATHLRPPHGVWWSRLLEVPSEDGSTKNKQQLHPSCVQCIHLIPSRPTNMEHEKSHVFFPLFNKKMHMHISTVWMVDFYQPAMLVLFFGRFKIRRPTTRHCLGLVLGSNVDILKM